VKKLVSSGAAIFLFAMAMLSGATLAASQERAIDGDTRGQFVGAWRLLWLEEQGADGAVHRADCTGLLVFTGEGRMSVQVMYRNPQAGTSSGPVQYAQGGYEATFGRYEIDERSRQFTFHVEGALIRSLVGKDLTRLFELSGRQLIVKPASLNEHWRVAWEHY
jgi:hypothetical protein